MRTSRVLLAAATGAAALLVTATAAQAAPVAGARYDAVAGKPRLRQFTTVSNDARRLVRYRLAANGTCSDGKRDNSYVNDLNEPRTIIRADGSFSHRPRPVAVYKMRGGKRYEGKSAIGFSGTVSPDGNTIDVKVTGGFKGKGLRCSLSGNVTLVREGTPGAPAASPRLANGRYPGTTSGRLRLDPFSMNAAAGEVSGLRLHYRYRCRRAPFTGRLVIRPQVLSLRDTYALHFLDTGTDRGGSRFLGRDTFTIAFFNRGGVRGYRGSFRSRLTYRRKGIVTDRCVVPLTHFGGRLPAS